MKTFIDALDRSWDIVIDTSAIKRVRELTSFDLLDVADGKLFAKLADDPILLVDVTYAVCKPIADERKISDEDFGRAMRGDAIERAYHAIIAETISFFPDARKREGLQKVKAKAQEMQNAMLGRAIQTLDSLKIEDLMQTVAGSSSGTLPAQ